MWGFALDQFTNTAPEVLCVAVSTNTNAPKMRDCVKGSVTKGSCKANVT